MSMNSQKNRNAVFSLCSYVIRKIFTY